MTVSTEVDHNDYTGNGATTVFPYQFRIFKNSDLTVTVIDTEDNISVLVLDTDYTVTGAGGYVGGNVTLPQPLANGYKISITRDIPVTQETDLRNQGSFFAEVHEDAFDKLTMLIQQVRSLFSLALRKPSSIANWYDALNNYIRNLRDPSQPQDAATKNYVDSLAGSNFSRTLRVPEPINVLPNAISRANKIVAFNSNGDAIVVPPQSGSASDVMIQLAAKDGLKYIGGCASIAQLRTMIGEQNGQQIFLLSWHAGKNVGGGIFQWNDTSTRADDGGCIIAPTAVATGRWHRMNVINKTPEMYGAIGDGNTPADTAAIQAMFSSENNHADLAEDFFGRFDLPLEYVITETIHGGKPKYVNAMAGRFIMTGSFPAFTYAAHNSIWQGGYFDFDTLLTNSEIDENAVALDLLADNVQPADAAIQVMHTKISSIRTRGPHTPIRMKAGSGYTWMTQIEYCELGNRPGASTQKSHPVNIEGDGGTNGGSTTFSLYKCSSHDFTNSPVGVGRGGFRIWNVSGVHATDISRDDGVVGARDVLEVFANSVVINGLHTERLTNNSTIGVEGPILIIGETISIDGVVMLDTDTQQNCAWITPTSAAHLIMGNWYQTKKAGAQVHLEYAVDASRNVGMSITNTGNLTPDMIYGAKTRQRLSFPGIATAHNVNNKVTVQSGGGIIVLPPGNASYELSVRGDSGGTLAFFSTVLAVKSKNNTTWSVKSTTVNTQESMPENLYPVSFTTSGNTLVFNIGGSSQTFDIQTRFEKIMAISDAF